MPLYTPSAAELKISAVDVARLIREQETHDGNRVIHGADVARGNKLDHPFKLFFWCAAGIDESRRHAIHRNAVDGNQLGEGTVQRQQTDLGNIMSRQLRLRD